MACLNHASFCLLPVARKGSCGPTREVDLAPHSVVGLVLQIGDDLLWEKAEQNR